ncbi:MAG: class I SAM-dependent methyltransferase [Myxococcota bacterium]
MRLYDELAPWYRLIDPVSDHENEATEIRDALREHVAHEQPTLLELGAGAGNNAHFLKRDFQCTLVDTSEAMLGLSREINPDCEHIAGDMRTLRLGREFDAVLVHDAVVYMTSVRQLEAAAATAFVHTRPDGAALFAPDYVRDSFEEEATLHEGRDGSRAMRCLEWVWDPDPTDDVYRVDYAFLLREDSEVRQVHDVHLEGFFSRSLWENVLSAVGYEVRRIRRSLPQGETDEVFLCRRP